MLWCLLKGRGDGKPSIAKLHGSIANQQVGEVLASAILLTSFPQGVGRKPVGKRIDREGNDLLTDGFKLLVGRIPTGEQTNSEGVPGLIKHVLVVQQGA